MAIGSTAGLEVQAYVALGMVSAIFYGVNILLCTRCLRFYLDAEGAQSYNSKRRRLAMCIYTISMFALATEAIMQEGLMLTGRRGTTIALPLAIWGADGFLIWRCFILYQGIAPLRRAVVYIFLAIYGTSVLVAGSALLVPQSFHVLSPPVALLICTGVLNLMVCGLISCRLLYAHNLLGSLMAEEKAQSPYIRAMTLCIESSGMIYIVTLVGSISTLATSNQEYVTVSIMLLPQICVLAPHLIIFRLSQGREHSIGRAEEALSQRVQSIHFARSAVSAAGEAAL